MRRAEAALAACIAGAALAGCAAPGRGTGPPVRPPFADPRLAVDAAAARLAPGRSTRAEVLAALGPAETLRFDSSWEVWAYRTRDDRGDPVDGAELVLLFDRAGVLRKERMRQGAAVR